MKNISYFENDKLILDIKKLTLKKRNKTIRLSKFQTRLLDALIKGVCQKEKLIEIVWSDSKRKPNDNTYNQLIFRTRLMLKENGLPPDFIITMPRYGFCINRNYIGRLANHPDLSTGLLNDHSCLK